MLPKKGNVFPGRFGVDNSPFEYAAEVAAALHMALGDTHRAVKILRRWTRASERTAKNWLSGTVGPNGHYLAQLLRESDTVLHAILSAAGRNDLLDSLDRSLKIGSRPDEPQSAVDIHARENDAQWHADTKPLNLPYGSINDPTNDRENDRDIDPVNPTAQVPLNQRQRWFLEALARGGNMKSANITRQWGVAEKTARRDISGLKASSLVEFCGSHKRGAYRLVGQ